MISLLGVLIFLLPIYVFTKAKSTRKVHLIIDGKVDSYQEVAQKYIKKHAEITGYESSLHKETGKNIVGNKVIVLCKVLGRIEGVQETALIQLDNRYKNDLLIFYIRPDNDPFYIHECQAHQINLKSSDVDEKVIEDSLSGFLDVGRWERFANFWKFGGVIFVLLLELFVMILVYKHLYCPLEHNQREIADIFRSFSTLSSKVSEYESFFDTEFRKDFTDLKEVPNKFVLLNENLLQIINQKQIMDSRISDLENKQGIYTEKVENFKTERKSLTFQLENLKTLIIESKEKTDGYVKDFEQQLNRDRENIFYLKRNLDDDLSKTQRDISNTKTNLNDRIMMLETTVESLKKALEEKCSSSPQLPVRTEWDYYDY